MPIPILKIRNILLSSIQMDLEDDEEAEEERKTNTMNYGKDGGAKNRPTESMGAMGYSSRRRKR